MFWSPLTMNDKSPEMTEVKTMWSESLLETLYIGLRKDKGDDIIQEVIVDLRAKKYDDKYIINKVTKRVGPEAAKRIESLLSGGKSTKSTKSTKNSNLSKADQARANAAKKRQEDSFFGKIMKAFFKK